MASISCRHIYKIYPGNVTAVKDFNLEIADKEFIVFVGPSGCGKSTTLRMIAGLEEISKGEMYIGERLINDVPPKDRDIAMVFQNYALYPHMTVYKNMAFGLELRKMPKDEIDKRVREAAKILEIEHLLDRKPKALSGGQRQRVALGRAMVRNPAVFLLDEPLSNLDAKLRTSMRTEIIKLHKKLATTFIYVTHDQTEGHVLVNGHVRVQSVVLEDHRDVAVLRGNVVDQTVTDVHLAAGDLLQTGDHTQGGGLTAAGRTDENDKFLIRDFQVEIGNGSNIAGVNFLNVTAANGSHNAHPPNVFSGFSPCRGGCFC